MFKTGFKKKLVALPLALIIALSFTATAFASTNATPQTGINVQTDATINNNIYSQTLISKEIRQVDGTVAPNSVVTISVKAAAKWLKSNWSKVYKKLPAPVKKYLKFNVVSKYIDAYVNFSNTIDEFLTKVVNACLPSQLEWMTPAIVTTISLLLPF
jgi:hypothetical protein